MTHPIRAVIPVLQSAPGEYNAAYVDQMIRALRTSFQQLANPGPLNGTALNLSALQGHGGGLRIGDLYHDAGVLMIVLPGIAYAGSLLTEWSVGSVTITT